MQLSCACGSKPVALAGAFENLYPGMTNTATSWSPSFTSTSLTPSGASTAPAWTDFASRFLDTTAGLWTKIENTRMQRDALKAEQDRAAAAAAAGVRLPGGSSIGWPVLAIGGAGVLGLAWFLTQQPRRK